ncbi:MAG: hypothetical protein IPL46_11370 [Saprospiraceae bacterium]|nr:hypothetical protein [Saprospiraceae bacterium]
MRKLTRGRKDQTQYRYVRLDKEEKHMPPDNWLIRGFREASKEEFYANLQPLEGKLEILLEGQFRLDRTPLQARQSAAVLFTRETFQDFPDLYLAVNHEFNTAKKITTANPQQKQYYWGDIELVSWQSFDGQELTGLLVKPENFDPSKKYPMIVNFYERSSDELHTHRAPAPGRSTINYSYYSSNGYLILTPMWCTKSAIPEKVPIMR